MRSQTRNLSSLAAGLHVAGAQGIARPRSRWKTRVALPFAIFAAAGGLLAYSARSALVPAVDVWVVPVLAKPLDLKSAARPSSFTPTISHEEMGPLLVQAPGWVEAAPYATLVPALAEGVVKEILVLEGDKVEVGQIIARMIDDDARLSVRAAEAELTALQAGVAKAEFDVEAAEARAAELSDRLARDRDLVTTGGVSQGALAQLAHRTKAAQKEIESAKAAIEVAKANVVRQEVALDEARLQFSRMEIRSAASGIVMSRLVEPGTRITMASRSRGISAATSESMSGTVARLYDPAKLQVRAEIPLADSAKIEIGSRAQITTEALPEKTLHGAVTRVVHEANIQRNTVQVKISIDDPVDSLKPEMLARVRLYAAPAASTEWEQPARDASDRLQVESNAEGVPSGQPGLRLVIPAGVLVNRHENTAQVWAVNKLEGGETVAELKTIAVTSEASGGFVEVLQGVRLGDRLIVDPPHRLGNGSRVRVLGEKTNDAMKGER